MKTTINVNRMQYGVGQGGFHCQEITVQQDGRNLTAEPYRFVYDCGSDTGSYVRKLPNPLEWSIKHFSTRRSHSKRTKVVIDTLYLSHFHKDHVNGVLSLSKATEIREIVIPYITVSQMVHIFAQQVSAGFIASTTPADLQYVQMLVNASGEGSLVADIHTTRVEGGKPDQGQGLNDNGGLPERPLEWPEFSVEDDHIQDGDDTKQRWAHQISRKLGLRDGATGRNIQFWELRTWSYAQSKSVSDAVQQKLRALSEENGNILKNLLEGRLVQKEIEWAVAYAKCIRSAYKEALKSEKITNANNDNVVSLCLHSAPLHQYRYIRYVSALTHYDWPRCLLCRDDPFSGEYKSWVGTGDAMLGNVDVWKEFEAHYGMHRIKGWSTIQIPHHGSQGVYFNSGLLDGHTKTAVISCGAFNKFHHPSMSTLGEISDVGGIPVVVTEMMRPGFFERLIYECN